MAKGSGTTRASSSRSPRGVYNNYVRNANEWISRANQRIANMERDGETEFAERTKRKIEQANAFIRASSRVRVGDYVEANSSYGTIQGTVSDIYFTGNGNGVVSVSVDKERTRLSGNATGSAFRLSSFTHMDIHDFDSIRKVRK